MAADTGDGEFGLVFHSIAYISAEWLGGVGE